MIEIGMSTNFTEMEITGRENAFEWFPSELLDFLRKWDYDSAIMEFKPACAVQAADKRKSAGERLWKKEITVW